MGGEGHQTAMTLAYLSLCQFFWKVFSGNVEGYFKEIWGILGGKWRGIGLARHSVTLKRQYFTQKQTLLYTTIPVFIIKKGSIIDYLTYHKAVSCLLPGQGVPYKDLKGLMRAL